MTLDSKNIIIGLSGGIACYKICDLIRLLKKRNANVTTILTKSASEFVTPLTLQTLSQNKVYQDQFKRDYELNVSHISLADRADLFLLAPATANIIGKIANGIADDMLTTVLMATRSPVFIAPAMNVNMWNNPILQDNMAKLISKGYKIIEPSSGDLACGYSGKGRLADVSFILEEMDNFLNLKKLLNNKRVLITLGGTKEYIDPVRCITNNSSGKMGIALIETAKQLGANVTAISTIDIDISGISIERVSSAIEMLNATIDKFKNTDILIMSAAVSDFRPKCFSDIKVKKQETEDSYSIELIKNPDILKEISKIKTKDQLIIGFAAETNNLIENAKAKLNAKKLDIIVANDVSRSDIGINSDYNEVIIIYKSGQIKKIPKQPKSSISKIILESIAELL